jgi:hypothetical protein
MVSPCAVVSENGGAGSPTPAATPATDQSAMIPATARAANRLYKTLFPQLVER